MLSWARANTSGGASAPLPLPPLELELVTCLFRRRRLSCELVTCLFRRRRLGCELLTRSSAAAVWLRTAHAPLPPPPLAFRLRTRADKSDRRRYWWIAKCFSQMLLLGRDIETV